VNVYTKQLFSYLLDQCKLDHVDGIEALIYFETISLCLVEQMGIWDSMMILETLANYLGSDLVTEWPPIMIHDIHTAISTRKGRK
jgi:hypothetical protein